MARWFALPRWLALIFVMLAGLAAPAAVAQDVLSMSNEEQKDWLTSFVQDRLSTPERQIRLSNIDGALGSDVSVREITISDAEGVWLRVNNATLNWNQAALFMGRLEVRSLRADSIEFIRNAVPVEGAVDLPAPEAGGFAIPEFPVAIILRELSVPSVTFGESVFGLGSEISLAGSMTLDAGNLDASLDIVRLDGPGGTLDLNVAYRKADNTIDLGLSLVEPENGVMANLLDIDGRPAVTLTLAGSGPVTDLRTDLELQANGQTALSGVATINQQAEGIAISADLRGPLATLIAEPYRPFFGAETALTVNALMHSEGGVSISGLRLTGGQLSLEAAAETTPDNFLRSLTLDAVVADPAGGTVVLPVPGSATRLGSAQLSVDFGGDAAGTAGGTDWSANLSVVNFEQPGLSAENVALTLGGVATALDDPAARRVTFNGDGTISGISGSDEVEAALGGTIGIGIAGLWSAGEPVQLAEFRIAGAALTAVLSGELDGVDFNGDINLETSSIAPFSGLAGRELDGALALQASGSIMPLSGGFDLTLDGTGTNLSVDDAVADGLLAGTVALSGRVARTEAGVTAENFRIANQQVQLLADGSIASDVADFTFNLDLSDLALLSDEASGALSVVGTARGSEGVIGLDLDANVTAGTLAGRALREGQVGFAGQYTADGLSGDIAGSGSLDGYRTVLTAGVSVTAETQSLADIDFQAAGTRITGGLARTVSTGLINGGLTVVSPDVSVPAALLLLEAEGALNAEVRLAPVEGKQGATLRGDVRGLVVNDIIVRAADIDATVRDLFGVPVVNGAANASGVSVAGVDVETLTARATQSGTTSSFEAQARLATGADLDIAGSLTPVDDGFRLALDQAQLQQGSLSARLAQPTVLQVAGSSVTLDDMRFDVGSGSITATGSAGETLAINLDINALPLSVANAVAPDLQLAGTLNGRASISGSSSDPQVSFEARAEGVNAAAISEFGIAPLTATADGSFRNGTVTLASLSANGSGGLTLRGSGTVPLAGNGLNLTLQGSTPLALGNRFLAERGAQLSGVLALDAQVSGSLADPQFGGRVSTSGAGFVDPELNLRLQNISGSARLSGTSLVVESLTASLATGGTVAASGSIGLSGGFPADLRVALNSARYADGNLFVATLSGNLALTGNLTGSPLLSGNIAVEEANITVPENFGGGAQLIDVDHINTPPAVEQTLQRARIDDRSGAPIPQTRPSGLLLDITLTAPNQVFIRGRGLDAEMGGSVRLTGPLNDIQPVGGFSLNRGRLSILGQRITFESGVVTLVGDLDPFLNLVARTEGDGITAGRGAEPADLQSLHGRAVAAATGAPCCCGGRTGRGWGQWRSGR
jgi:translocation and assembly module TamB